ncbi:MAG: HAMP domain-containing histidine kinase [Clostridiales bacterium]|nr:HAMP domain-containing histidine kinase [Clostridiales bacterium]
MRRKETAVLLGIAIIVGILGLVYLYGATGYGGVFFLALAVNLLLVPTQWMILTRNYRKALAQTEFANVELEEVVAERTEELQKSHDAIRELISNISHDLRTPMTAIRGYIELMIAGETDKEYLESAYLRVNQVESLISDLFLLTQITEKKMEMNIISMDTAEFLRTCQQHYQSIAEQNGISLITRNDAENSSALVDRNFIMRITDNLMQNAFHYAASRIRISACREGDYITIIVADDGPGIDPEIMPYIFDRFYKKREDGAGLGLSIVKELAGAMNGEISVRSVPRSAISQHCADGYEGEEFGRTELALKLPVGI